jgi:hypothetical protein
MTRSGLGSLPLPPARSPHLRRNAMLPWC